MSGDYEVIILGAGPAGLTAALYAARAKRSTLVLGERPGGSPVLYDRVDNYPGFPGGVPGAQLMLGMVQQVDDMGVARWTENAEAVVPEAGGYRVRSPGGEARAPAVILATGCRPCRLRVPGEEALVGRGVFYCAHCDAPVFQHFGKVRAVVVGGGNSAVHTALYVAGYAEEVVVVHRGAALRADQVSQEALRAHPKVRLRLGRTVEALRTDGGQLAAVVLRDAATGDSEELEAQGLFVGIGQEPNREPVEGLVELSEEGFVVVDAARRTSREGLFAAGDVVAKPLRQIVTAAADGAVAADSAIQFLALRRPG
ncbi:MAG: thioredoxin-disulfide reductase [Deferrisomatales bacterium]